MVDFTDEAERLASETRDMASAAGALIVQSQPSFELAAADLIAIKAKSKELDALRRSMTKPIDEAKEAVMTFFRAPTAFLADAEAKIKRAMLGYQAALERERQLEERRLRAITDKEAERLRRMAEKADAKGHEGKAELLREQADTLPVPIVAMPRPEAQGISTREIWSGEVTDKLELIRAVAAGVAPEGLVMVDMKVLGQMARSLRSTMRYPGVRAVVSSSLAART